MSGNDLDIDGEIKDATTVFVFGLLRLRGPVARLTRSELQTSCLCGRATTDGGALLEDRE
jgi:hypothetical protein